MENVRESIRGDRATSATVRHNANALMVSEATKTGWDKAELPKVAVATEEPPLVDPRYAGNTLVAGASAVVGFDVTKTPPVSEVEPVQEQDMSIPSITPVTFSTPVIKNSVQPAVVEEQPVANITPVVPSAAVGEQPVANITPVVPSVSVVEEKKDEVVTAINEELIRPKAPVQEVAPLQTPQEFTQAETNNDKKGVAVNVIVEMGKVRDKHLAALREIQAEINRRFEALLKQYQVESDDLIREAEKIVEGNLDLGPIEEAVNNQNQVFDNSHRQVQGL